MSSPPRFYTRLATFVLLVLVLPVTASAQQGTIGYSHTRPLLSLPGDQVEEVLLGSEAVTDPTHVTILRTLLFDVDNSLMYPSDDDSSYVPGEFTASGKDIGWEFIDSTYIRHGDGNFVESRKFDEEIFLVEDTLPSWSWRLAQGHERTYLGYRVMKATSATEMGDIEAWFTPEIPVSAGPGLFHGLPGLILMVTNNDTGEVYAAEKIDLTTRPVSIDPPAKGKRVTSAKYVRFVELVVEEKQQRWEKIRDKIANAKPADVRGN